ncbi:hypothetical protein ACFWFZ_03235 [Streptomyces sp. NPDC060232]|uniref:hypothetical protein n=1 Tax=Streptomyces sp. NPDC060232 TaxID=3347079 RepID=UPI0036531F87
MAGTCLACHQNGCRGRRPGRPELAPRFDWVGKVVFNGRPENIDAVSVDGRPLKLDGRLVGVDPGCVVREAEAAAGRPRATG